jgi:hypothetical protein
MCRLVLLQRIADSEALYREFQRQFQRVKEKLKETPNERQFEFRYSELLV